MRSRRSVRPALAVTLCAAALLGAACFGGGGGGGSQATPPATTGSTPSAPSAASPVASPPAVGVPSPIPLSSPIASPAPSRPSGPDQTHTVEAGETLATIAQKFYGDSTLWRKIYDANRPAIGDNPDAIKVGTQLRIPPKE